MCPAMSSQPVSVSVVVTCFNHGEFLSRAMTSVLEQTLQKTELLIVDDGSTDGSRQLALDFSDRHPEQAMLVLCTRNSGLPRARNRGIALSRSPYVCCLDADDWFSPTALEAMLAMFVEDPSLGVVRPSIQNFGTRDDVLEMEPYQRQRLAARNIAPYCSMFKRKAWVEVGGFDESMPAYEDWSFWVSVAELGCTMGQIPEPVFHYRNSDDGMFARAQDQDLELRARIVLSHPLTYTANCQTLAARILSGEDVSVILLHQDLPEIFTRSPVVRRMREVDA